MHHFTDSAGRAWNVHLTVGAIRAVKAATQEDLCAALDGTPPLYQRLASDMVLFADVLAAVLGPQMTAAKVTAADLDALLEGKTLAAASDAFFEELADFFQGRGELGISGRQG